MRLTITKIIEEDTDRVLFEGETPTGDKRTFHLRRDPDGQVDRMVELVKADTDVVQVDL